MKVAVVWGTRPEVIKLAPVVQALRNTPLEVDCINTGQQWDLSVDVEEAMDVVARHRIRHPVIYRRFSDKLGAYSGFVEGVIERTSETTSEPYSAIICQGDTVSTIAAASAGFHQRIPVVHVEAGLRSMNPSAPWPEEMHRRLVTQLATLHCCPSSTAKAHVTTELGVMNNKNVIVTGNTIVDAVQWQSRRAGVGKTSHELKNKRFVLVTHHRRENECWIDEFMLGLIQFAHMYPSIDILFPQHPNTDFEDITTRAIERAKLKGFSTPKNLYMPGPLRYFDFLAAMYQSEFVVSDSGGVSEEAAILRKHQLITRMTTERPELVRWGFADQILGEEAGDMLSRMQVLLHKKRPPQVGPHEHPFGKPGAGIRVAQAVCNLLNVSHEAH
jgi:UDP-N-acetylglucosamine 2-epimerase (non-hydrolysing)